MDAIATVLTRMTDWSSRPALYWQGAFIDYAGFLDRVDGWSAALAERGIGQGTVCGVYGDYSPGTISLMFALMRARAIIVPYTPALDSDIARFSEIAEVAFLFRFDVDDGWTVEQLAPVRENRLIADFLQTGRPGLVVFSSGSTGVPKGILHDCERVMRKFVRQRLGFRTVLFLMMDHFGGFNTMLGALAYGGVGVCPTRRLPKDVCVLIEESKAGLLPTTPTFLNLLLASGAWRQHDLSSIELITYGTEVMPESTQKRLGECFPGAQLKQTYGLSELGVLRSKSRDDGSTWVKVGGAGFEIKVVDDLLWVRAESNMVGYLNAPDPFDGDGWMCTGDRVEIDGDYMRFLGRESDIINVGGQKVFPAEVENVLLQAPNIKEATVVGKAHPLLGQVVIARLSLDEAEDRDALAQRLRRHCNAHLTRFKVPARFTIVDQDELQGARFKKQRRAPKQEIN